MDSCSLIQSLLSNVSNLPHRDSGKLDALRKRAKMILTKTFGQNSQYIKDLDSIHFYPMAAWDGMEDEWYNKSWRSGATELANLLKTTLEDLELSKFEGSGPSRQSAELAKNGIRREGNFQANGKPSSPNQVFHIQKFSGVFGNVSNSQVTLHDYGSVHQLLVEHGISKQDRRELEDIMDEIKGAPPERKLSLLERGEKWLLKHKDALGAGAEIISKAISG